MSVPADGYEGGTEAGVRGQDAVIAMAVEAGWRDQPGRASQELERGEQDRGTAVEVGTGQAIEQPGIG